MDDLLFFPISLSLIRIFQNSHNDYEIPVYHSLIGLIIISLLFEYLLPKLDLRFTSDFVDILYYVIGIIVYHLSRIRIKKRISKRIVVT